MTRPRLYLEEILTCIDCIREYTRAGRDDFKTNRMVQDAVIRNIEVIGEASKCLPPELKAIEPVVPWRNIGAMRDLLIHRYFRIDLDRVWDVVVGDLDLLEAAVRRLLASIQPGTPDSASNDTANP